MTARGLPHSGISGSLRARRSPEHFAVRRALHRLLAPRHPPAALCNLIIPKDCGCVGPKSHAATSGIIHQLGDCSSLRCSLTLSLHTLQFSKCPAYFALSPLGREPRCATK